MRLFFGGAEIKSWRELLQQEGVETVAVSFIGWQKRSQPTVEGLYPGQSVFLDSGGYTYNKEDAKYEFEDAYEAAALYMDFVKDNIDYVSLVSEFDARQLGSDYIESFRTDFYSSLPPEKFMPIWHEQDGREALEALCAAYPVVGISQSDIHGDTTHVPILNSLISRYGVRLHGVGITSKKLIEAVKWDSVSSTSWLSPSMYGDTFVWTGRELKRYPKAYKDRARKTHRNIFMSNGFDYAKIDADDSHELLRLSIWSWKEYINSIGVTTTGRNEITSFRETPANGVHTQPSKPGTEVVTRRTTEALPVMSTFMKEPDDDDDFSDPQPLLNIRSESMRICNTCVLKDTCPGFLPDSNCLYNIPIEIRTKDQLRALHDSLIEMQTQRVLFMKMAEDQHGGYVDANLSSEMDRLNRMIKTKVEGDRNSFSMVVEASGPSSGPSAFDKYFGSDAANKLRQLEQPEDADTLIAEVLSESEVTILPVKSKESVSHD
jgi:hypothetical protein